MIVYYFTMVRLAENPLDRLLEPVAQCLTPDVARQLAQIRIDPATQKRIDELAVKANEGELSVSERETYEGYIEAIDVLSILQAKARSVMN